MMPQIPDYLFIDDASIKMRVADNVIRTEMSNGMSKVKPRQSIPVLNISFSVSMQAKNFEQFRQWFISINYGASWFLMRDPLNGNLKRYRLASGDIPWTKAGNLMLAEFNLETYYE